jgi:hypothetical protein
LLDSNEIRDAIVEKDQLIPPGDKNGDGRESEHDNG